MGGTIGLTGVKEYRGVEASVGNVIGKCQSEQRQDKLEPLRWSTARPRRIGRDVWKWTAEKRRGVGIFAGT